MNLWHEIEPGTRDNITTIVEINKGSKNKYEVDKETGLIKLDRALHTAQDYPFDYGFVPQTLWEDGDPLDVVILTTYPLFPGTMVHVRPIGALNMTDAGDDDIKIIAVPHDDPRWDEVTDLAHANKHTLKEIEHFFQTYKQIQKKEVKTNGYINAEEAMKAFDHSLELYQQKFAK